MEISVAEAHNRLSQLLKEVRKGPVRITRRGKPVGVIIDPEEYDRLRQVQAYLQMIGLSQELRSVDLTALELYNSSRDELKGES